MTPRVEHFWAAWKARSGEADDTRLYEVFSFGDSAALADELAALVMAGTKRATAGLLWAFEGEGKPLPQPGALSILTDAAGTPLCIIETIRVDVVPFDRVDADFAATEGEGDGSLDYWRAAHTAFFGRECVRLGRGFSSDMPVVCERFRVVFRARTQQ